MYSEVARPVAVRLRLTADDAIIHCGQTLAGAGVVDEAYVAAMRERERAVSTAIGDGVALPHAAGEARHHVRRSGFAVLQFPDGAPWSGGSITVCVAIASHGDTAAGLIASLTRRLLEGRWADWPSLRRSYSPRHVVSAVARSGILNCQRFRRGRCRTTPSACSTSSAGAISPGAAGPRGDSTASAFATGHTGSASCRRNSKIGGPLSSRGGCCGPAR